MPKQRNKKDHVKGKEKGGSQKNKNKIKIEKKEVSLRLLVELYGQ